MFQHKETTWGPVPPDSPPSTLRFPCNPALALVSPVLQRPTKVLCATRPLRLGSPQLPRTAHSAICFPDPLSASGCGKGYSFDWQYTCAGHSVPSVGNRTLRQLLKHLHESQLLLLAGAGNKALNSCTSPLTPSNVQRFSTRKSLSTCFASNR